MTLSDAPVGQRLRIKRLHARPEMKVRLREMGFCEDAVVRCVTKSHGNVICEILNTRVGMNRRLAREIHVATSD